MATGSLSPLGRIDFYHNGAFLQGGTVATLITGTSTPTPTYTNAGLTVPNLNPILLDSDGSAVIYLDPSVSYKFQIFNSLSTLVDTWDPVTPTNAGTAGLGELFVFGGNSSAAISNTTYPSGATYDKLLAGTATYPVDSATLASGTYVLQATGVVAPGGNTLSVAIVDLDDGAPDTPLSTVAITSTTGQTANSAAITFALPGAQKHYGIKVKVDSGTGFAWGIRIMRTA